MITFTSAQLDAWIAGFFWPFVRMLALLQTAPVLGHRSVPARAKIGLAILMTVVLAPTIQTGASIPIASSTGLVLLAQQILIGVAMGFTLRIIFAAVELAGEIIGTQMGLNFAGFFDPATAQQGTPIGAWLGLLLTLVFVAMNGHLLVLYALAESFRVLPIDPGAFSVDSWRHVVSVGGELFRIGVYASLPVMAAMLVCNLAMGVLARVAPQINVLAVGFSVTILVGFLVLVLALPVIGIFLEQSLLRGIDLARVRP
jgi:flagellar biosynthesis protein FliR